MKCFAVFSMPHGDFNMEGMASSFIVVFVVVFVLFLCVKFKTNILGSDRDWNMCFDDISHMKIIQALLQNCLKFGSIATAECADNPSNVNSMQNLQMLDTPVGIAGAWIVRVSSILQ